MKRVEMYADSQDRVHRLPKDVYKAEMRYLIQDVTMRVSANNHERLSVDALYTLVERMTLEELQQLVELREQYEEVKHTV